jgi:uncharacterized membrane protein
MEDVFEEKISSDDVHHHGHHGGGLQEKIFEQALQYMNSFGSIVLLFGVVISFINFFLLLVQYMTGYSFYIVFAITQKQRSVLTLDRIKLELARMIGFSLLLLVAADVLETLLKPGHAYEMDELYKMISIGGIRTTLAYFLGKETEEILHHIAAHSGHEEHSPSSSSSAHYNGDDQKTESEQEVEETTTTTTGKSVTNATIVQKQKENNNSGGSRGKNKRKQKKN